MKVFVKIDEKPRLKGFFRVACMPFKEHSPMKKKCGTARYNLLTTAAYLF